jgi:bifunctional non-homologous end joining protein LigD
LIAFDLLRDGDDDLRGLPLTERRARLEQRLAKHTSSALRLSEQAVGDGRALHERARARRMGRLDRQGGAGAVSERPPQSRPGASSSWSTSRNSSSAAGPSRGKPVQYFGRAAPRREDDTGLKYVGHTGTGFNEAELKRVSALLKARAIDRSPFTHRIKTNEPAHWVRAGARGGSPVHRVDRRPEAPSPVYLGLRDDKKASSGRA